MTEPAERLIVSGSLQQGASSSTAFGAAVEQKPGAYCITVLSFLSTRTSFVQVTEPQHFVVLIMQV